MHIVYRHKLIQNHVMALSCLHAIPSSLRLVVFPPSIILDLLDILDLDSQILFWFTVRPRFVAVDALNDTNICDASVNRACDVVRPSRWLRRHHRRAGA